MSLTRRLIALASLLALTGAIPDDALVDPYLAEQWALAKVGAPVAWATATGEGVTIAVIDTGVDLAHEDLGSKVVAHVSCVGAADDPAKCHGSGQDDHGHGTHVAGVAAATTSNGEGVASAAPDARIMAVKVLEPDADGGASGATEDVRAGIRWALDHGADVINLSLGEEIGLFSLFGTSLDSAINDAWEAGAIPVVAAGNDAVFPSGYHLVKALVVTATDQSDEQASYASNVTGAEWGMAAPGGDGPEHEGQILSTWWEDGEADSYGWAVGTSMAAPHVAGAAAALLSLGLSPQDVVDRVLDTAVDLGAAGRDNEFGWGRLDLAAAVDGLGTPTTDDARVAEPRPPAPDAPPPSTPRVLAVAEVAPSVPPHPPAPPAPASAPEPTAPTTTTSPAPVGQASVARRGPHDGPGPMPFVGGAFLALAAGGWWLARRASRNAVGAAS